MKARLPIGVLHAIACTVALTQAVHGQAPATPTNLVATVAFVGQLELTWSDPATTEIGFRLERSLDGITFAQIAQLSPNSTRYRDIGLFPQKTYHYRVSAFNGSGASPVSDVASATTPALPATEVIGWGYNGYGQTQAPSDLTNAVMIAAGNGTASPCWLMAPSLGGDAIISGKPLPRPD